MSRRSPLALLLLLGLLIGVLGAVPAHAVALGGFEIDDGNIADGPAPGIDWAVGWTSATPSKYRFRRSE